MYSFCKFKSNSHIAKSMPDHKFPNDSVAINKAIKFLEEDAIDVSCGIRVVAHLDPEWRSQQISSTGGSLNSSRSQN